MTFDLYAWASPRDLDTDRAAELIQGWLDAGGDPASSPFEPSTDVGWFYRELIADAPDLETATDAVPTGRSGPIWMSAGADEPPARVVAMRIPPGTPWDELDAILGLATKYDLQLFDARDRRLHRPLDEMAAYASATFWPAGAIRAGVAGAVGALIAGIAWVLGIPILSGILVIVGAFLVLMSVLTFVHEGRKAMQSRGGRPLPPAG